MNKLFILFLFSAFIFQKVKAQVSVEDAKGQSSILYRNSNISFDLTQASLSASINNFRKIHVADKPSQLLYGFAVNGKNEEGLSVLWNEGNLTAASSVEGFLGYRFRGYHKEYLLYNELDALAVSPDLAAYKNSLNYSKDMNDLITKDAVLNFAQKKILRDAFNTISKNHLYVLSDVINEANNLKRNYHTQGLAALESATDRVINFLAGRVAIARELKPNADLIREHIEILNEQIDDFRKTHRQRAFTVFLNSGMNAISFRLYSMSTNPVFSNRFKSTQFRGGFLDAGFNYDFGPRWIVGTTVGYEKANTFDSLSKKDYTIKTTEISGNQELISEKKYTGFSGFYKEYNSVVFKTDLLYFSKINDDFRLVLNVLYSRWYLPMNENNIKGIANIGTGINFYKQNGSFVGGVYLQENDAFNNLKSENSNFWKRLNLGITTKFSFEAIADRLK